ncbi:MAG TPA: ABC transporter permease [Chloroflexota bacterium]|nr:ABC transporter permease [Chloroflexota bacterium]
MQLHYLFRRLGQFLVVLWGAATLNFLLPRLAPGNPVRERLTNAMAQGGLLQEGIEDMVRAYNREFGLDQPLYVQYLSYLGHAFRLDFGYSIAQYPRRVAPMIWEALPWTIALLVSATLIAFALGTLLGALMAWPRAPRWIKWLAGPSIAVSSIPYFLLGLVLVYLLGVVFPIFPLSGGYDVGTMPGLTPRFILDALRHSLLPALSLVVVATGAWALHMRGMMVTTEGEDYTTYAEAKGLTDRRIFYHYALRNAILPQVTALALSLGHVVSGAVIVEKIFGYPGVGSLLFQAISGLDYFLIYGIVFMTVLSITFATIAIDLVYPLLDPRIAYRRT